MSIRHLVGVCLLASLCFVASASAQIALSLPQTRLIQRVDESDSVSLIGNVHPRIAAANASMAVDPSLPMERMILHLKSSASQDANLAQLIAQQSDPKSPLFHKYLTPQDYGTYFGVAASDIATVTSWLTSHGFTVDQIPAGNRSIVFSGTAGQVANAFKTEIRSYNIAGARHIGNASDPQIPAALAEVVGGIVQLHDFQSVHSTTKLTPLPAATFANPQYNTTTGHYLSPADFAVIYDVNPLYTAGLTGAGQSIAVVSRSDVALTDIEDFRSTFGLPANDPETLIVDIDPGVRYDGNGVEATLDVEWAGAIAPQATIKLIAGNCTNTSDGVTSAEMYAVNHNIAPIISVSYGLCEVDLGSSGAVFYNALWQQAAAQGQTVVVSSGDTGAAACNSQSDTAATTASVNGLCSSPYSTCVGGTEFVEGSNPGQYWLPGNNPSGGSVTGYIPETVWNESGVNGGSGVIGGGGGASVMYPKPAWQTGVGVPADGKRDVPDLSLSAAQYDGYVIYDAWAGGLFSVGGTSLSTPSFAALVALINQKTGAPQGLVNPTLYALAAKQAAGGAAVFHDITTGNNSVPGLTGFSATTGYDPASGLGSVDAAVLVNHWTDASPQLSLMASSGTLAVNAGQSVHVTVTTVASAALNATVQFVVSGLPAGASAAFSPASIAAPGSGSSTLTISATGATKPGAYTLVITATGGGQMATLSLPIVISAPSFLVTPSTTNSILNMPGSAPVTIATSAQTGFSAALTLAISGAPAGTTVSLSAKSVAAPGTGSVVLNVAATGSATPGKYPLTLTVTGGGQTQTIIIYLVIPTFTVTAPASSYKGAAGSSVSFPVTITPQTGFGSSISLQPRVGYLPAGVTASFSTATVSGGSSSTSTVTLTIAKTVPNGAYPFFIDGKGGNITQGVYEWLLVGYSGSCSLYIDGTVPNAQNVVGPNISVTAGQSAIATETCMWPQGSFSAPLSITMKGIPAGVTVQPSGQLLGNQSPVNLNIGVVQAMPAGTYNITAVATASDGFSTSAMFSVVVTADSFAITPAQTALSVVQGTSAPLSVTAAHQGVFNAGVSLAWSGLPAGVTATLAKSGLSAPGDGTVVTTFSASSSAVPGSYTTVLTATGGGITRTVPVTLTIPAPTCKLGVTYASKATALAMFAGQTGSIQASCSNAQGTFSGPLALSLTGAPSGVTAQTTSQTMAAGGSTAIQVSTPITMAATTFNLSLTASNGSFTQSMPVSVAISASNFALTPAQSTMTIPAGGTGQLSLSSAHKGMFNSAVSLAWSGLPSGVTASLTKSILAAPGDGAIATVFSVGTGTAPGTYSATLTATGGDVTQTIALNLTISAPTCTFAATSTLALAAGQTGNVQVSCTATQGAFGTPLALSVTGAPAGVTAQTTAATMVGGGSATVQVITPITMAAAKFTLSVTATSRSFTKTVPIAVTVSASTFTMSSTQSALSIFTGASGTLSVKSTHTGVFNSAIGLTWSGLPSGVTAALSTASLAVPGDGTAITTFTVSSSATPGTYRAILTATGGGITQTVPVNLTVVTPPSCTMNLVYPNGAATAQFNAGQSASASLACINVRGSFSAPLALSVTGAPSGVTPKFSASSVSAGNSVTLTVSSSAGAVSGTTPIQLTLTLKAVSGTFTSTTPMSVTILPSTFTLTAAQTALSIKSGTTPQTNVATALMGSFNSTITNTWSGLPAGITASYQAQSQTGVGLQSLAKFTVGSGVKVGTYTGTWTATGGGITKTLPFTITITQ